MYVYAITGNKTLNYLLQKDNEDKQSNSELSTRS
jgi:hypothetical protein